MLDATGTVIQNPHVRSCLPGTFGCAATGLPRTWKVVGVMEVAVVMIVAVVIFFISHGLWYKRRVLSHDFGTNTECYHKKYTMGVGTNVEC